MRPGITDKAIREIFQGLIALVLVVGIIVLRARGVNHVMEGFLAVVVTGYLGIDIGILRRIRRRRDREEG